jgi:pyruvate formate lyase activating enzyme
MPRGVSASAARDGGATRALCVGGLTPFTTIDYPGRLAAVVFVQGCPWRCVYCHNPHLQRRDAAAPKALPWEDVCRWLERRTGLIDAVVFSGGEPTIDPALPTAMAQVRALGFRIGLHTAGLYPRRLQQVLPLADWVGLDVKAPLADDDRHARITGVRGSAAPVRRSLAAVRASGVDFECRTTAHPELLDDAALLLLADDLAAAGVTRYALQLYRRTGTTGTLGPVAGNYPAPATEERLQSQFGSFTLRRA